MSGADAYAAWLEQWRAARPESRLVELYCTRARARDARALGLVEHLLREAVFGVREPELARNKLAWWVDELAAAQGGGAGHPVARELAVATGAAGCQRVAQAAARLAAVCDGEAVPDVDALLARHRPAAEAFAACYGDEGAGAELAAAWLIDELRDFRRFAEPRHARVPLVLLARAGQSREALVAPEQCAAGAQVARAIARALAAVLGRRPPGGLLAARCAVARTWAAHLLRAHPDAAVAAGDVPAPRLRLVLALWRARS